MIAGTKEVVSKVPYLAKTQKTQSFWYWLSILCVLCM